MSVFHPEADYTNPDCRFPAKGIPQPHFAAGDWGGKVRLDLDTGRKPASFNLIGMVSLVFPAGWEDTITAGKAICWWDIPDRQADSAS